MDSRKFSKVQVGEDTKERKITMLLPLGNLIIWEKRTPGKERMESRHRNKWAL